ncbi:hypothetical protein [Paenibacillus methanolicus]|uniref:Uncharacterized protein n=1 Tax=Paenibacillus methanolicus TaxID=582686 RepID=A0A5S5BTM9_9BACL|nr:hypothetical protein [Paenibacillus methanolicus]TYP68943.1 hypothetical protein BCM02_11761 [Paenibacillus methanolicus]
MNPNETGKKRDDQTAVDTAGIPIVPYREDISATDSIDPVVEEIMDNIEHTFVDEEDNYEDANRSKRDDD